MILTYVNAGTSGPEGINYLFSERDANGKLRDPPAQLLSGDVLFTKYLIAHNEREKKYSSYSLNFRDNEKVTDDQLKEILQSLRDTFCTGLGPDQVNMLAVKHTDKNNIELHIVINDEELTTGRQFNAFPPGERSKKLQQDFCAYWNHKLGFEQVVGNPFKASFSRFDAKTPAERKHQYLSSVGNSDGSATKERKEKLSAIVTKAVMSGKVNNRNELIAFLEKNQCKITRRGKDYLSIKLPGKEKAIRFKDGAFVEHVDYRVLIAEHNSASKTLTSYQFNKIRANLANTMDYKRELHAKIYAPKKPRMPKSQNSRVVSPPSGKAVNNKAVDVRLKENTPTAKKHSVKPKAPAKQNAAQVSASSVSVGNSHEALGISIASVADRIFSLGLKLSQVPAEQRAQIEIQIAALKIQLEKLQQQLEESKKAELNRGGPSTPKFK